VEHFACTGPCCWYEELDPSLADEVVLDLCFSFTQARIDSTADTDTDNRSTGNDEFAKTRIYASMRTRADRPIRTCKHSRIHTDENQGSGSTPK
jgi:hypothetical protein